MKTRLGALLLTGRGCGDTGGDWSRHCLAEMSRGCAWPTAIEEGRLGDDQFRAPLGEVVVATSVLGGRHED
jgi:hypothetical protein